MKLNLAIMMAISLSGSISAQELISFKDSKTQKAGFKDAAGKIVVTPVYDTVSPFVGGLAVVGKKITYEDYAYGLLNSAGKIIIPAKYTALYLRDGFIVAEAYQNGYEKSGFFDKTGKMITPMKYDYVGDIGFGMARVGIGDKYGYIDRSGKEIIALKYENIYSSDMGLIIAERNEKKMMVNKTGKETPLPYERIGYEAYGRLLVQQNGKYGFINTNGEIAIPLKFDNAYDFVEWQRVGYLTNVRLGNKSGFIDTLGREIIPIKYDFVKLFRDGLAPVCYNSSGRAVDERWGYVDSTGNFIIPMNYNSAGYFREGLAAVSKKIGGDNFTYGYIDKQGKEVIAPAYQGAAEFSEGLAAVKKNGKYGFIDQAGNVVIPFEFDSVYDDFDHGRAKVVKDGKQVTINRKGEYKL